MTIKHQQIKVLHLSGGTSSGGAAKGVINIHKGLLRLGIDSKAMFSMQSPHAPHIEGVFSYISVSWIDALLRRVLPRLESILVRLFAGRKVWPFSLGIVGYPGLRLHRLVKQADVIHLHWINAAFVSVSQISQLKKPVVWTMRDEWAYTGGCHYSCECVRFKDACGQCPILDSRKEQDLTRMVFNHKAKLRGKDIRFVAISNWIAQRAQQSALLRNESVEMVLNCIDSCFIEEQLLKRADCREHFGFDQNELLLLCGATDLDSKYKGYSVLPKFQQTKGINYRIVTFGQISDSLKSKIKVPSTHLGNIGDNESLCKLYRACDVFLGPSHMEAFGKTLAEASACGLPVVAYDYGGPKDVVRDGISGLLIEPFNESKFVEAVMQLCHKPEFLEQYGMAAEEFARGAFSPEKSAVAYQQIYTELMKRES